MSDLQAQPRDARIAPLLLQGTAYLGRNALTEAEALLDRVLAIQPFDADAVQLQGMVRQKQGHAQEAETLYRRAISRDPLNMPVHQHLNHLLNRLGRDGEFPKPLDDAETRYPQIGLLPLLKSGFLFPAQRITFDTIPA